MKRVGQIIGMVGGALAIIWAMRDRFVSIASPREPEPPTFRVVSKTPAPSSNTPTSSAAQTEGRSIAVDDPDDLTQITGVGPVFQRRLMEAGLATFSSIAEADTARVANAAGVPETRAADWITQAGRLRS